VIFFENDSAYFAKMTVQICETTVQILPSVAKDLLRLFCNSNCIHLCSHTTLSSSSNVNIVERLVSMPDVRVFVGYALTTSFDLAATDFTFNGNAFCVG